MEPIITIASTHETEEKLLLDNLKEIWKIMPIKVFLAPRHPERFKRVESLIKSKSIPYQTLDTIKPKPCHKEQLFLINKMGFLPICFQLSNLAIMGGSFVKKIGGHNILEPIFYNIPVFFGPYMHSQYELKELVLSHRCGREINTNEISSVVIDFFQNPNYLDYMKTHIYSLKQALGNSLEKTFDATSSYFIK
jgi:3-deoxy-D-manno-octulosonic-acid transferase